MVWETVKKEMTITRVMLALVAILLCCFLAFGLPHKTEKLSNKESGLEMLNRLRHYLEQNKSHTATPQAGHHGSVTTTKPKHHKFTSKHSSFSKTMVGGHTNKQNNLDVSKSKHASATSHSGNLKKNESKPGLDLVVVFNMKKKPEVQHKDPELIDVKDTNSKHVNELMFNNVVLTKTVRVSKVEEVFEDLVAQNVRRIIKEDRVERVEVAKDKKMETIGNDIDFDHIISI